MSGTAHQAIADKVSALLAVAPAIAAGGVLDSREYALPATSASQIHVLLGDCTPSADFITGAPIDWQTEVEVLIKARRSGGVVAEKVADAVWLSVWSRLMANQSLDGLVYDFRPGEATRDRDEADTDVACLSWKFSVGHRTANNSIAA